MGSRYWVSLVAVWTRQALQQVQLKPMLMTFIVDNLFHDHGQRYVKRVPLQHSETTERNELT